MIVQSSKYKVALYKRHMREIRAGDGLVQLWKDYRPRRPIVGPDHFARV